MYTHNQFLSSFCCRLFEGERIVHAMASSDRIALGDFVFINGGGTKRITEVKKDVRLRMGRTGTANASSLVGLRYGEVVRLDHRTKCFVATNEYPDLDLSELNEPETEKDNRDLVDDNRSQVLTSEEVAAIRKEQGLGQLLNTLVEKSTTFQNKTSFSQEKYLRKKQKKYGTLFKIERVTPDNMAEVHLPTVNPSDDAPEDARCLRLRADTVALLLHHSDVHEGSRVVVYDKTNGVLGAYLLTRLGETGQLFHVLDRNSQPNTFPARVLQLPSIKERWKAVPRNAGLLEGKEESTRGEGGVNGGGEQSPSPAPASVEGLSDADPATTTSASPTRQRVPPVGGVTQWLRGLTARQMLQERPADSLIIVDDENPDRALDDLMPFLAPGGHIVVYSPFLEDLTALFARLRADCVNVRISETWYRHYQVLSQRTHPTVNMSTAAGYLLTAIKAERNPTLRSRELEEGKTSPSPPGESRKRGRDEDADDALGERDAKEAAVEAAM